MQLNNENVLLGYCMQERLTYQRLICLGLHEDMLTGNRKIIFNRIADYRAKNEKVDAIVINNLKGDGITLDELNGAYDSANETIGPSQYEQYFQALKREHLERKFRETVKEVKDISPAALGELANKIMMLSLGSHNESSNLHDAADQAIKDIEKRQSDGYEHPYRTGYHEYDLLGHFEPGSLAVIGGESGHGKSTFALNLIYHWLNRGLRVVLFSFEMSPGIVITKLNLIHKKLSWSKTYHTKGERLTDEELGHLITGYGELVEKPLLINTTATSIPEMEMVVRTFKADVVVLDTINHLIPHEERADIALGNVARQFKRIAGSIDGLCVIIAQLKDIKGRPTDKNLVKESRQIRDAADYMDNLYRSEEKNMGITCPPELEGILEIFRVKGRLTGKGKLFLFFDQETGVISELQPQQSMKTREYFKQRKGR